MNLTPRALKLEPGNCACGGSEISAGAAAAAAALVPRILMTSCCPCRLLYKSISCFSSIIANPTDVFGSQHWRPCTLFRIKERLAVLVSVSALALHCARICTMDCCNKKRLLTLMTSICACTAFGLLCIAVSTDYWLYTNERTPSTEFNHSDHVIRRVHSGLWRKCEAKDIKTHRVSPEICSYIRYFTANDDREGLRATDAILLNVRRATMFPLASLLILLIGGIMCFIGHCNAGRKILTFVCGILFVLAGLCTLVGIILYIGSITEEVGNKPRASIEEPKFTYNYGSSFIMAVGSFILTEFSGVFSVYLYVTKHKYSQKKKTKQALKVDSSNDRANHWRARKPRSGSRERGQSREQSRETSASRSESYFTYTPISDTSHELSNYNFQRDISRNTISTTAELHVPKELPPPSIDIVRRTTPV